MEKQFNHIYHLLENVPFSQLSEEDRTEIIEKLDSLEEFRKMQMTLNKSKEAMNAESELIEPSQNIWNNLQKELPPQQNSTVHNIFKIKIPAYYSVAASLLVFFLSMLLFKTTSEQQPLEITMFNQPPKEIRTIDTVYVTKEIRKTIYKTKYIEPQATKQYAKADGQSDYLAVKNQLVGLDNLKYLENDKKGKNISEDSITKNFITSFPVRD